MSEFPNGSLPLHWALPRGLNALPDELRPRVVASAHMSLLTALLALLAAALLIAGGSSLPLPALAMALACSATAALAANRAGVFGLSWAFLVLSTTLCIGAFLSLLPPSSADALALAPAALLHGILGRRRPGALVLALILPLAGVWLARESMATLPLPPLLQAFAPIAAAALIAHSIWRGQPAPVLVKPAPVLEPAPPPKRVERRAPAPGEALRVLVVDDIPVNRMVVSRMLQARGLKVMEAASGAEALEMLDSEEVDLVFLDLHMPGLDGIEVARRLRARGDHVPLVALTADAVSGTREACLAAGMDAFLNKPAPPQVLFQLVEGLTELQNKAAS